MATTTNDIVAKLWTLCHVLRDDGITYNEYVTELTFLLFLKMLQETEQKWVHLFLQRDFSRFLDDYDAVVTPPAAAAFEQALAMSAHRRAQLVIVHAVSKDRRYSWGAVERVAALDALRERVAKWLEAGHVVIGGDMNVAPTDSDIFHPDAFVGSTHVTEPERAVVRAIA